MKILLGASSENLLGSISQQVSSKGEVAVLENVKINHSCSFLLCVFGITGSDMLFCQ